MGFDGATAGGSGYGSNLRPMGAAYASIVQGTWSFSSDTGCYMAGSWYNTSSADGDGLTYDISLDAGTYTLIVLSKKWSDRGIVKFYLDATLIATIDLYAAAATRNVIDRTTSISVASSGTYTLTRIVDGKNGASSDYFDTIQEFCFVRE